ncbi:MAG TPA: hypothetical protein VEX86_24135 [Longimicrobium sp.]|nr:hypothetical protein [Longimicrobium sp.]
MKKTLSAAALALLAACSSATGLDVRGTTAVRVQTDARSYGLINDTPVPVAFTVTNTTSDAVAVSRCGDAPAAQVERYHSGRWEVAFSGICPAVLEQAPLMLAPGATLSGVVQIQRTTGSFRLVVPLGEPTDAKAPASSPSFTVRYLED